MIFFFFFNDTATTEIYTLSLHDALPIFGQGQLLQMLEGDPIELAKMILALGEDRKSTLLNSSHTVISYAVFCLKKKMAGVVLAIRPDGDLLWYRYTGDGTADQTGATGWEPNSSNPIGRGWQNFQQVLGGL